MQWKRIISGVSVSVISACFLAVAGLSGCGRGQIPEPGVSFRLAQSRKAITDSVAYTLHFTIPASEHERIDGRESVRFYLMDVPESLILDFKAAETDVREVEIAGKAVPWKYRNEHVILPGHFFHPGWNEVNIGFLAGDMSMNRNKDFMYSLFVPARARTAFPCFDQPDLKAVFSLTLDIPSGWEACANGPEVSSLTMNGMKTIEFQPTKPLPSYLFAFAAGKFSILSETRDGRTVRLFHRETDPVLLSTNVPEIFRQVFASLDWLEKYTGIPYPFAKYDMIAIPSFQYGGMEHAGATLYRASGILLPEHATEVEKLSRANLIAHETSHMWFGDLVTMRWFNEVWLKEVFANFIAEKITDPWFPDVDFNLKFLLAHYPQAYDIDRTAGTNPVEQKLTNLENAGSIYGPIIYHKAPIVMRKLESIAGEENMHSALQEYLNKFAYGNAGWDDLISILDGRTPADLKSWSHAWVDEAGMPEYKITVDTGVIRIVQTDPAESGRVWPDIMEIIRGTDRSQLHFTRDSTHLDLKSLPEPILNSDGSCYGSFIFENDSALKKLMYGMYAPATTIPALSRSSGLIMLYGNLLRSRISPKEVIIWIVLNLQHEHDPLVLNQQLGYCREIYWKFLADSTRADLEPFITNKLWDEYDSRTGSEKKNVFRAVTDLSTSAKNLARLRQIWDHEGDNELSLSEQEMMNLCYELALKDSSSYFEMTALQKKRIKNPDRLASFEFIIPALSPDPAERDRFFSGLKDPANREREAWVLTAMYYLNHPLRQKEAVGHLYTSLNMLKDIQRTGDIFFPGNWLDTCLWGHHSREAASLVRLFLQKNPDYPEDLKAKIQQSSDKLFRSVSILKKYSKT